MLLIYNVLLVSAVKLNDSVIHLYIFFFRFFSIVSYYKITEYCSLYYSVNPVVYFIYSGVAGKSN